MRAITKPLAVRTPSSQPVLAKASISARQILAKGEGKRKEEGAEEEEEEWDGCIALPEFQA